MEYQYKIDDTVTKVEATPLDSQGRTRVTLDGQEQEVGVQVISPQQVSLTRNDRRSSLFSARGPDGLWIWSEGQAYLVVQEVARRSLRGPGAGQGLVVTPPMPALVVQLLVEVGQPVRRGQALVVVSAMKMEMTLVAPKDGVVRAVNTRVGAKVSPGDTLVDIDYTDEDDLSHE